MRRFASQAPVNADGYVHRPEVALEHLEKCVVWKFVYPATKFRAGYEEGPYKAKSEAEALSDAAFRLGMLPMEARWKLVREWSPTAPGVRT